MDFKSRLENNGINTRYVSNTREEDGEFAFDDFVSKEAGEWKSEYQDTKSVAEDMYETYESLEKEFDAISVTKGNSELYWATVKIDIPEDPSLQKDIAEKVAEAISNRLDI